MLVCYDLLGLNPDFKPKFVKRYADLYGATRSAAETFFAEVRADAFPDEDHSFKSKTIRLVSSNPASPAPSQGSGEERVGSVYGVPV